MSKKNSLDKKSEIYFLDNPDDFFNSLINTIENTKETLELAYFIILNDYVSHVFLGLIYQAAERGVKVRILSDALGEGVSLSHSMSVLLNQHKNISVQLYNKPSWNNLKNINNRMHLKFLISDGKKIVSGGRNIGDSFFGRKVKNNNPTYLDNDIFIYDKKVAGDLINSFDLLWSNPITSYIKKIEKRWWWKENKITNKYLDKKKKKLFNFIKKGRKQNPEWFRELKFKKIYPKQIEVICDISHLNKINKTAASLYDSFSQAKKSILCQSPYFIPTDDVLKIFKEQSKRNIKIELLTNSIISTENIFAIAAHSELKKEYEDLEIKHWEYYNNINLHQKVYIIDEIKTIMGVFNLDPRSEKLNLELLFFIDSQELSRDIKNNIEKYKKDSCLTSDRQCVLRKKKKNNLFWGRKIFIIILRKLTPFLKKYF